MTIQALGDRMGARKGPHVDSLDAVKPIKRQPVADQVAQQILGLIKSGSLRPGQQLPAERALAEMLDVSRPSLREALRALSLLGVVTIRQGGGIFISSLDPEALLGPLHFFITLDQQNIDTLFEARIAIESTLTGMAAERASDEQVAGMKDIIAAAAHAVEKPEQFIELDVAFHNLVFEATGNPFLVRVARSLHILSRASREITGHLPGVLEKSLADHRRIFRAIEKHDADHARAAMAAHLKNVWQAYRREKPAST